MTKTTTATVQNFVYMVKETLDMIYNMNTVLIFLNDSVQLRKGTNKV